MKRSSLTSFIQSAVLAGGMAFATLAQAQTITGISPDGTRQFQYSPTLSFLASSAAGVTNVTVALTEKKLSGVTTIANLTATKGLTITGPNTGETVSAVLKSNRLYSATITIQDANGASANSTVAFDTIIPSYTFEAEDWNYTDTNTMVSGLYIDNPQTNAYAGKGSTDYVDAHNANGGHSYRPGGDSAPPAGQNGGLATEGCGDKTRAQYVGTGFSDYDVGYTDNGDWANYTRHFPAGTFNIFMRAANPNGANADSAEMSGPVAGRFAVPNTGGWQTYAFVPLTDASGNWITFTSDGSEQTILVSTIGGSYNANFFMFLPPDTETNSTGDIAVSNIYPDGSYQFQATNTFAFTVTSSTDVSASDIIVLLTATNLQGQGTSQTLISGSGLTVVGTPNNWSVTAALTSNTVYTATIQVTDANNSGTTTNVLFDTITPAYTFEAEDWNYGGGSFIDNPQTNAYSSLDGVAEIDYHRAGGGGGSAYGGRIGLATENASDVPRVTHVGSQDYDIGNAYGGNWANYTRTFPSGTFNLYVRVSNGNGNATANAGSISLVTNPTLDTSSGQTASLIGSFDAPPTGGWQKYAWAPVKNANGDLVRITGGAVSTLRYTVVNGGHNPNFFLLMPADLSQTPPPYVSGFQPDGANLFQITNQMSFTANSYIGMTTNNVLVQVDGVTATNLSFSGSPTLWTVTGPVRTNAFHTVVITLTDAAGTSTVTNKFDTFDPNNYTFEAEDYNFGSGQFYDSDMGIDVFAGLGGTLGIDYYTANSHNTGYRGIGLSVEGCGDIRRPAYAAGSYADYDVGDNNRGFWGNYTRTFPAGMFYVYIRLANGGGVNTSQSDSANLALVTSDPTAENQTTTRLGIFAAPYTGGWQTYTWSPLTDASGNLVPVILDGTPKTLRLTVDGGYCNQNFFMLVPVNPAEGLSSISNLKPDGTALFQFTNAMTFTVTSPAGIATSNVVVYVDGMQASGLTFTGTSNQWNVTCPVSTNVSHTVVITVTDANGTASSTNTISTFSSANYQWEAEDYDYGGGQFFDNPQTNAYANLGSVADVDNHQTDLNANPFLYRLSSAQDPAPSTQTGDLGGELPRAAFTSGGGSGIDYCIGYFGGGSWVNYTRHYPAGTYYVIGRFAEGANLTQPTLSLVTSGVGTTNQTLEPLGTFTVLPQGWSSWEWATLTDSNGRPAKVTVDGSATTLRYSGSTVSGQAEVNTGFFMLSPTVPDLKLKAVLSGANIIISFPTQTGLNYQVMYKANLSDASWTPLGSSTPGNGAVQSVTDSAAGASRFYQVQSQ
jgi:Carbohydrate binding module (family 6)